MSSRHPPPSPELTLLRQAHLWCALAVMAYAVAALAGWSLGDDRLAALGTRTVPMAPNTAVAFLVAALGVFLRGQRERAGAGPRLDSFGRAAALVVLLLSLLTLSEHALALGIDVDRWLVSTRKTLGEVPLGTMSNFTALAFAALGLALVVRWDTPAWRSVAGSLALGAALIAGVFLLGYAYGAPLLAGTPEIPMAISTSGCFVLLGVGATATASMDVWPVAPLASPSLRGLLLRAFLPVVLAAIVVEGLIVQWLPRVPRLGNPALGAAAAGVLSSVVLALAAGRIALRVARTIERAEQNARTARDSLIQEAVARAQTEAALERTRSQLLHAQKLEPMAQLAGGVAHDFNNLLSVILGQSDLLAGDERLPRDARELAAEVSQAARSSANLTQQLLAFSRRQVMQRRALDVNELVRQLSKLVQSLVGPTIDVVLELKPGVGCVHADPSQMEQVLMNLAINAAQAMTDGGTLTIGTRVVQADAANLGDELDGSLIELVVSDTGSGMDALTLTRLFEPFFTTKGSQRGTGLGLATVHGIVHQSGGRIRVESREGAGSTFRVYLPRHGGTPTLRAEPPERAGSAGRGERVLLVDDDPHVRRSTRRLMERRGFAVVEAATGREALELVQESPGSVDVVVSDLVMAPMSGVELARHLRELRPDIRVLFVSGYASDSIAERQELEHADAFLQKPFTPEALTQKLREVLDGSRENLC